MEQRVGCLQLIALFVPDLGVIPLGQRLTNLAVLCHKLVEIKQQFLGSKDTPRFTVPTLPFIPRTHRPPVVSRCLLILIPTAIVLR